MTDVFVHREGSLSWVSASGNSNAWATGATSPSGTAVAFVSNFSYPSAQDVATISNRGTPNHQKVTNLQPPTVSFDYLYTGAAGIPNYPVHIEVRWSDGTNSAFHQFHRATRTNKNFSENPDGNSMSDSFTILGMIEATASGYLSH